MRTPARATRTSPGRPWLNAGSSTRADMPGPAVHPARVLHQSPRARCQRRVHPLLRRAPRHPAGPPGRNRPGAHQNMRVTADLEEQGEHHVGQGDAGAGRPYPRRAPRLPAGRSAAMPSGLGGLLPKTSRRPQPRRTAEAGKLRAARALGRSACSRRPLHRPASWRCIWRSKSASLAGSSQGLGPLVPGSPSSSPSRAIASAYSTSLTPNLHS